MQQGQRCQRLSLLGELAAAKLKTSLTSQRRGRLVSGHSLCHHVPRMEERPSQWSRAGVSLREEHRPRPSERRSSKAWLCDAYVASFESLGVSANRRVIKKPTKPFHFQGKLQEEYKAWPLPTGLCHLIRKMMSGTLAPLRRGGGSAAGRRHRRTERTLHSNENPRAPGFSLPLSWTRDLHVP